MPEIDVNAMIRCAFVSATMKAAVHLGQYYQFNMRKIKNMDFEKVKQVFDMSQKLTLNQSEETSGISTIDWNTILLVRTTLLHDRAVTLSKAREHVFSHSVLCRGRIHECPRSIEAWKEKNKNKCFTKCHECRELDCIDGETVEFERTNFPGLTTLQLLREIQNTLEENRNQPEKFEGRIIFMSMYKRHRLEKSRKQRNLHFEFFTNCGVRKKKYFPEGRWSFLARGTEEQWCGTHTHKPNGLGNDAAEIMMIYLGESGHPVFGEDQVVWPEDLGKGKEEEKRRYTIMEIQRQQSCCFASSFPSTSSVSTERYRFGAKNSLS